MSPSGGVRQAPSLRSVMRNEKKCRILVHRKDTYRRTGRTKSGFEMHYSKGQCARAPKVDGMCLQHSRMKAQGWNLLDCT